MSRPLEQLALTYRFSSRFLDFVTEGFSEEDWFRRPGKEGNHAHWILGHVTVTRRSLLRSLGMELPVEPWEAAFARGSKPAEGPSSPPADELKADFQRSGEMLHERLSSLSPEAAEAPHVKKMPDGSTTVSGAVHFLLFHEASHLGQIGLLRRILGKPGRV